VLCVFVCRVCAAWIRAWMWTTSHPPKCVPKVDCVCTECVCAPGVPHNRLIGETRPPEALRQKRLEAPDAVGSYLHQERGEQRRIMPRLQVAPVPQVGDTRISYKEIPLPSGVSVLASKGDDGVLRPWQSRKSQGEGGPRLFMIRGGRLSGAEMLCQAGSTANIKKWALRGGGWLLMWAGSYLSLSWLPNMARWIPGLGGFASALLSSAIGIATFGASFAASTLVISAAWIRFRPLHAALLGSAAAAGVYAQNWLLQRMHSGTSVGPVPSAKPRGLHA